jgi:hypothetical protein
MMNRVHYPIRCLLDHKERWLIWHTIGTGDGAEADGIVVNSSGGALVFRSQKSLIVYAQIKGLSLAEENKSAFYNLDVLVKWLKRKRPAELDCVEFLNAWNLLADMSVSIGSNFDPDKTKTRKIYSKLFWGNNLPVVTPTGKHYNPLWPGRESRIIQHVLREGLSMFRRHITEAWE